MPKQSQRSLDVEDGVQYNCYFFDKPKDGIIVSDYHHIAQWVVSRHLLKQLIKSAQSYGGDQ